MHLRSRLPPLLYTWSNEGFVGVSLPSIDRGRRVRERQRKIGHLWSRLPPLLYAWSNDGFVGVYLPSIYLIGARSRSEEAQGAFDSPATRRAHQDGIHPGAIQILACFDFSWGHVDYYQETLENLKMAVKSTTKLCAVILDMVDPELQVANKSERAISLEVVAFVVLTPDQEQEASSELLPINFSGLSKARNVHPQNTASSYIL